MEKKPCVIALGQFDSVHPGHVKIIEKAVSLAKDNGINAVVFTFDRDIAFALRGAGGSVYSAYEREKIFETLGADETLIAPAESEFLNKSRDEFLRWLDEKYCVKGYCCGFDYRFGKNAEGDAKYLKDYAAKHGKICFVADECKRLGEKISTTKIKRFLEVGEIEKANELLYAGYFVTGTVQKERGVGRKIGFPTINVYPDKCKVSLKKAVYAGRVEFGGVVYPAIVNYGARPTFGLDTPLVEAHMRGFDGDLYGQTVTVFFDKFIRDIKKFLGEAELKAQLERDIEVLK